jgi:hypothetical protein
MLRLWKTDTKDGWLMIVQLRVVHGQLVARAVLIESNDGVGEELLDWYIRALPSPIKNRLVGLVPGASQNLVKLPFYVYDLPEVRADGPEVCADGPEVCADGPGARSSDHLAQVIFGLGFKYAERHMERLREIYNNVEQSSQLERLSAEMNVYKDIVKRIAGLEQRLNDRDDLSIRVVGSYRATVLDYLGPSRVEGPMSVAASGGGAGVLILDLANVLDWKQLTDTGQAAYAQTDGVVLTSRRMAFGASFVNAINTIIAEKIAVTSIVVETDRVKLGEWEGVSTHVAETLEQGRAVTLCYTTTCGGFLLCNSGRFVSSDEVEENIALKLRPDCYEAEAVRYELEYLSGDDDNLTCTMCIRKRSGERVVSSYEVTVGDSFSEPEARWEEIREPVSEEKLADEEKAVLPTPPTAACASTVAALVLVAK